MVAQNFDNDISDKELILLQHNKKGHLIRARSGGCKWQIKYVYKIDQKEGVKCKLYAKDSTLYIKEFEFFQEPNSSTLFYCIRQRWCHIPFISPDEDKTKLYTNI